MRSAYAIALDAAARLLHDVRQFVCEQVPIAHLLFMRSFAQAYPDAGIVKRLVSQLPWGHVIKLLQRVKDAATRHWYMQQTIEHGWSREVMAEQIERRLHARQGKLQSNFELTLPPARSDMAAQLFKDPYIFDFVGTADPRRGVFPFPGSWTSPIASEYRT